MLSPAIRRRLVTSVQSAAAINGELAITWSDGSSSSFNPRWLWHQCPSFASDSGQRLLNPSDIPAVGLTVEAVEFADEDRQLVTLSWNNGHSTAFQASWLRTHSYSHLKPPAIDLISSSPARHIPDDEPSYSTPLVASSVAYDDMMESDEVLLDLLHAVARDGICKVSSDSVEPDTHVMSIANRIARVQSTIYGDSFEVSNMENPINVAYTTLGLGLHMDLAYYESPPGLQLLHCTQFDDDVIGGESLFLDGFAVAEHLRQTEPDAFDLLTKVPGTLQKVHYARDDPVHMVYQRPPIAIDAGGHITGMFWAPPFEGPLKVAPSLVDAYFDAYTSLARAVDSLSESCMLKYRMKPGETTVFNNRRILHGRTMFDALSPSSRRALHGCYVNIDEFLSKYRYLCAALGATPSNCSVGNQAVVSS